MISNSVIYLCYEQANRSKSSLEHRNHPDALPQGQRPGGARATGKSSGCSRRARRPKRSLWSPATARHGSAPLLIATMRRVPKVWATGVAVILAGRSSSRKRSFSRLSMSLRLMAVCGLAPKSPTGSRAKRGARYIRSGAGSILSGSTTPSGCCGHATPKPILPPKKLLKKPSRAGESGPASVSPGHS